MPAALQSADLTVGKLTTSLRMPHVPPRQAADAIKHLLHLQAEGARSARNLNPVKLYLEAQVSVAKQVGTNAFLLCAGSRDLWSIYTSQPFAATNLISSVLQALLLLPVPVNVNPVSMELFQPDVNKRRACISWKLTWQARQLRASA